MFRNRKVNYREKFRYAQDWDLYLRLLTRGEELQIMNSPLTKRRIRPEGIGNSKGVKQSLFAEKAQEFYIQRQKGGEDKYKNFDPAKITQKESNKHPEAYYRNKMRYCIEERKKGEAKKAYRKYCKYSTVSFKDKIKYKAAIEIPIIFDLHKKRTTFNES